MLLAGLRDARAELKDARRQLRRQQRHDEAALARIREQLDRVGAAVEPRVEAPPAPEPAGPSPDEASVRVGQRYYVPRLRTEVDVVEGPSKGRVRVASGPVKLWVKVEELRSPGAPERSRTASAAKSGAQEEPARPRPEPVPSERNTVDVRGMRVDDALAMTESFLDRMFGNAEPVAYVLHGVGTGALRDAIREHLVHVGQYVARSRPGTLEEGGERITVVYLR